MTDDGPEPRYPWTETWPGEGHKDYVGLDDMLAFGRIFYEHAGPTKGQWRWAISHIKGVKKIFTPHNGWKPTARLAAQAVEDHYEKLMEANNLPYGHGKRKPK